MNIYDFDGTIYDGDSSIDFFVYCLQKNKRNYKILLDVFIAFGLYMLKIITKEQFKSRFFGFIKVYDDVDLQVEQFWQKNRVKIKRFYLENRRDDDVVVSASPEFLLEPVSKMLQFNLIATKVDKKSGKLVNENCYGKEKVKRLNEVGIYHCDEFYSDSLSDYPVSQIAEKSYVIKKEQIIKWGDYKETEVEKVKSLFLNPDFFTFIAIGIINVINGIGISYVYSLFIQNAVIAYVFGFLSSLTISYILNSLLNFKEKLSLSKYAKFAASNIPNFVIQITSVLILLDLLNIPKLVVYTISAVIAVPVTYILVKLSVFKNEM